MDTYMRKFQALGPLIAEICGFAGTPGLSLGVLHHGKVTHQANFGLRDVNSQAAPDENTSFVVGSLTKAITAAMVAIMVEDGKLAWNTQLRDVLQDFHRDARDPAVNITITDLLSHRTGLPSYDSLWLLSDNRIPIHRADAAPLLGHVPIAADLRTEFIYNNIAYEVLGQVIEKVSGTDYFSFLKERILNPLGMERTFYTDWPSNATNVAKAYYALHNASAYPIPPPLYGKDVLIGAAGGIRSSVSDLLTLYRALIDAANTQIEGHEPIIPHNPLRQLNYILQGKISLPLSTVREASYASGWLRLQLPSPMGLGGDHGPGIDPMLGKGLPSRLGFFHQGNIPGFTSFAAVFPETSSAVVVLTNSLGLTDSPRLVGQLLIEELFGNAINATDYSEYAKVNARESAATMSNVEKELIRHRTVYQPLHPLSEYVGKYYNLIGNFFIEIQELNGGLAISFMGTDRDRFDLEPYQCNSFFWVASHDEMAQRARYTTSPKEFYIIKFGHINIEAGSDTDSDSDFDVINGLWWKHEFTLQGKGEFFRKSKQEGQRSFSRYEGQLPLVARP
ncbi:putative D-aminoacylase [Triangularia verruculosa]|uniref:D-aminoacylase n=1 Tax=Triangularia verruculosa TaxID=2587418 RepID=A0AAN7AZQ8_9PEZI|nr:putative D-aminoacylase [Triangularia verruculosa]